jgi:hypothetical protein
MANTIDWGKATQNNTNGFGKYQNTINAGSIYGDSYAGETAIVGTSASFLYSKSSYNQGEADPTPTITGTAGGSFNASANVVFVDTGTFNSSTGQIDLSATGIGSHIITYTVNGVQSGQTVGVTAVPYQSTSSFTFDGINDYFDAGNPTQLQMTGDISVSAWFKTSNSGSQMHIAGRGANYSTTNSSWALFRRTNNGIAVQLRTGGAYVYALSPATTFNDGNWHHAAFTREVSSGNLKLYIDGSLIATTTGVTAVLNNETKDTFIGADTVPNEYFNGNIDEVSIWNSALSSDAITEIASGPNDLTSLTNASNTNLKAWYKL